MDTPSLLLTAAVTMTLEGVLLELSGEAGLRAMEALGDALTSAHARTLGLPPGQPLTVDLRRVSLLDSSGVTALLGVRRLLADIRRVRVLLAAGSQPARVLQNHGVSAVMDLTYPTE